MRCFSEMESYNCTNDSCVFLWWNERWRLGNQCTPDCQNWEEVKVSTTESGSQGWMLVNPRCLSVLFIIRIVCSSPTSTPRFHYLSVYFPPSTNSLCYCTLITLLPIKILTQMGVHGEGTGCEWGPQLAGCCRHPCLTTAQCLKVSVASWPPDLAASRETHHISLGLSFHSSVTHSCVSCFLRIWRWALGGITKCLSPSWMNWGIRYVPTFFLGAGGFTCMSVGKEHSCK